STMSTAPFGVGGRPRRKTHPFVEDVPRIGVGDIARSLSTASRASGTSVRVVVNGKPELLDVVFEDRNYGGRGQPYFLCGTLSRRGQHLYLRSDGDLRSDGGPLAWRRCSGGLSYFTSQNQHH